MSYIVLLFLQTGMILLKYLTTVSTKFIYKQQENVKIIQ